MALLPGRLLKCIILNDIITREVVKMHYSEWRYYQPAVFEFEIILMRKITSKQEIIN